MLILASASTARRTLLEKAGIAHKVMVSNVDESSFEDQNIEKLVQNIAIAKAKSVESLVVKKNPQDVISNKVSSILGCDSLLEFDGEIYGKPSSNQEAIDRWEKMSSKTGLMHTGHCLLFRKELFSKKIELKFNGIVYKVITTKIQFSSMTKSDIFNYVKSGEPLKCAGGFALEGKGGTFINKIDGCFSNVIGLSLPWLRNQLVNNCFSDDLFT